MAKYFAADLKKQGAGLTNATIHHTGKKYHKAKLHPLATKWRSPTRKDA